MNFWLFWMVWATTVRVWVQPQTLALAPQDSAQITVELEVEGTPVPVESPVRFEVLPSRLGRVRNGWFIAQRPGVGVLRAIVSYQGREYAGHAALQIAPRANRLRIVLDPMEATLRPGGTLTFHTQVLNPDGTELSVPVSYKVVPPWLGTVDEQGVFRAGDLPGEGHLIAWAETEGRRGLARAKIRVLGRKGPQLRLRVEPRVVLATPGETLSIRVWTPRVAPENLQTVFFLDPPHLGQIQDGQFIAGSRPGRGMLWIYARTPADETGTLQIPVVVAEEERLPKLQVEPKQLHLQPGDVATVRLTGERIPLRVRRRSGEIHWEVRPKVLAKILGDPTGPRIRVRALRTGVGLVVARIGRQPITAVPLVVGQAIRLQTDPPEIHVGDTFRVLPTGPSVLRYRVMPKGQVEPLGEGAFRALQPGPVWIFGILPDRKGGGVLRLEIQPAP